MRIWDLSPRRLCRAHLLGEHRELHAIWTVLTQGKQGYSRHPETLRWKGKLRALYRRHDAQVVEMRRRNYQHHSPLDRRLATGRGMQDQKIDSLRRQCDLLRAKGCDCYPARRRGSAVEEKRPDGAAVIVGGAQGTQPVSRPQQ